MRLHKRDVKRGSEESRIRKGNTISSSTEMKKTPYRSRANYKKEILGELVNLWKDQTQIMFTLTWRLVTKATKEESVHWTVLQQKSDE
jgi:hypothetical protein